MKYFWVGVLTALLLLSTATLAMAGTVYFDYMPSGSISPDSFDYQDVTLFDIGVNVPVGSFVISAEYISGSFDLGDDSGYGLNGYEVDFGYTVIEDENIALMVFLGYGNQDVEHLIDYSVSGFVFGFDLKFLFGDSASLGLNVATGINGNYEDSLGNDEDADVLRYNLKFNYYFNENIGVSIGYRCDSFTPESDIDYDFDGLTVGMGFKF